MRTAWIGVVFAGLFSLQTFKNIIILDYPAGLHKEVCLYIYHETYETRTCWKPKFFREKITIDNTAIAVSASLKTPLTLLLTGKVRMK